VPQVNAAWIRDESTARDATYESVFVGDVVGQFEFVERDRFAHPLFTG